MKYSHILLIVLILTPLVSVFGQDSRSRGAKEATFEGLITINEENMYLTDFSGEVYLINFARMGRGAGASGDRAQSDRNQSNRGSMGMVPPASDIPENLLESHGQIALVYGMVMNLPPGENPFGDVQGILFPMVFQIDGEDYL